MNPTLTLKMIKVRQISPFCTLIVYNLRIESNARYAMADCQK